MTELIKRDSDVARIQTLINEFGATTILGARQCGKTTLAKMIPSTYTFDLENPRDLARLDNPQLALEDLRGLVVIDEIQRKPDLFPLLRYLIDQDSKRRFLILGSASRDLIHQSSETLAGRIAYHYLSGLRLSDVGAAHLKAVVAWSVSESLPCEIIRSSLSLVGPVYPNVSGTRHPPIRHYDSGSDIESLLADA